MKTTTLKEALKGNNIIKNNLLLSTLLKQHPSGTVYKVKYPYGECILKNGKLNLLSTSTKTLDYTKGKISCMPLALVLKNSVEISEISINGKAEYRMPLHILKEGEFFGIFEVTDFVLGISSVPAWNVFSGGVSIRIMADIGNAKVIDQIRTERKFERLDFITHLQSNHYELVKLAENGKGGSSGWFTEILFFSDAWFTRPQLLNKVKPHLLEISHLQSSTPRRLLSQQTLRMRIKAISKAYPARLQHIVDVMNGTGFFFEPAIEDNNIQGPFNHAIKKLHDAYVKTNVLKQIYFPVMMQPVNLSSCKNVGYIPLRGGFHYAGDRENSTSGRNIALDIAKALAEYLKENPELKGLLNNVSLVFFAPLDERGKDNTMILEQVAVFHKEQDISNLGNPECTQCEEKELKNEKVENLLPNCFDSKEHSWNPRNILLNPIIKVIPTRK